MEYLYTERCHVPCHELPQVFQAANELLLTELTEGITLKVPLITYLRLALTTEENRVALLELCTLADSVERPGLFIATSRLTNKGGFIYTAPFSSIHPLIPPNFINFFQAQTCHT